MFLREQNMVDLKENAKFLGIDLLFIVLWITAWNATDIFLMRYLPKENKRLILYGVFFVAAFVALLFISRN